MTLNYRIHWVDDSPEFAEGVRDGIVNHFEKTEVNIEAKIVDDGEGIENTAFSEALDLFVLDYHLDGRNGDELINALRGNGELTEIVFYSQDVSVCEKFPSEEGVHTCIRVDAEEKIRNVVDRFIDRSKNVAVMRGMIISEAIDLENRLTAIIIDLFGDKGELFRDKILNKPRLDFNGKRMFIQSVMNDILDKARENKLEDTDKIKNIERLIQSLADFKADIIDQRNILAHCEKKFSNGVLRLSPLSKNEGAPILFDNNWKNTIRENIKKHMKNIYEIRGYINSVTI